MRFVEQAVDAVLSHEVTRAAIVTSPCEVIESWLQATCVLVGATRAHAVELLLRHAHVTGCVLHEHIRTPAAAREELRGLVRQAVDDDSGLHP